MHPQKGLPHAQDPGPALSSPRGSLLSTTRAVCYASWKEVCEFCGHSTFSGAGQHSMRAHVPPVSTDTEKACGRAARTCEACTTALCTCERPSAREQNGSRSHGRHAFIHSCLKLSAEENTHVCVLHMMYENTRTYTPFPMHIHLFHCHVFASVIYKSKRACISIFVHLYERTCGKIDVCL